MNEKVEYDGYYLIDVVSRTGHKSVIACRGYNLKSWLGFERTLESTTSFRAVTEKEYRKYDIMSAPYEEEPKAKKATVKKTVAKPAAKKAPAKKAVVKKTPAKKAVNKTTKAKK